MFGGSASLNPFPPGWGGFPGDPGGRRHCAFVRLLRLPGYRDIALRAERSGPTPASKSSKAQPAPGLLLEAQGGRGEVSGSGRAVVGGRWDGHPSRTRLCLLRAAFSRWDEAQPFHPSPEETFSPQPSL